MARNGTVLGLGRPLTDQHVSGHVAADALPAKLRALAVADDYRRQGIASALITRAMAIHREHRAFFMYGQFPPKTPPWPGSTDATASPSTPRASRSSFPEVPGTAMSVPRRSRASRCSRARSDPDGPPAPHRADSRGGRRVPRRPPPCARGWPAVGRLCPLELSALAGRLPFKPPPSAAPVPASRG
ncbi:GNAT family N-acetyltransferase [Streptomyces clavifer]|uniref:GNAT family N-acetyltransferase n=1 Tax=Streptomyces clavifer TaxID=68188 RepID=UPI00382F06C4